jgi:1-acyl-sn-glycerol-3-phosphate acyltransferase
VPHPPVNRLYDRLARILRLPMVWMTRRTWTGAENFPDGAFIAASNHMTNVDPLVTAHYLYDNDVAPRIMAKSSLFTVPVLGWALRSTGQIPVYRGSAQAGDALVAARESLENGECVLVFPEGTLTRDPDLWPMVGKTGTARLALMTRAPVVPIAQWGATALMRRYQVLLRPIPPKKVWVCAGRPVDLSDLYDKPLEGSVLREATERIMSAITELLAEIRREPPPVRRWDMRTHGQGGGRAL